MFVRRGLVGKKEGKNALNGFSLVWCGDPGERRDAPEGVEREKIWGNRT